MAVSGTVATTSFNTNRIIDQACRECRLVPQQITPEIQESAKNQLYLLMQRLANKGIPLWCIEKQILPLYQGQTEIPCNTGSEIPLNVNLRTLQRLQPDIATASEGVADNAFDGDLETSCDQTLPAGNITAQYNSSTNVYHIGILPDASGPWDIEVSTSDDGVVFNTVYANDEYLAVDGEWLWIDLAEGDSIIDSNHLNAVNFVRLDANGTTILKVREFVIANGPTEIPLALINRDDYMNLPNKDFQNDQPVQYWLNRQRDTQIMQIWPAPSQAATFKQLTALVQRQLMDVGSLTQSLDFPRRWFEGVVLSLAYRIARSRKEVDPQMIPILKQDSMEAMGENWDGETDSGPVYLRPNISPYTR